MFSAIKPLSLAAFNLFPVLIALLVKSRLLRVLTPPAGYKACRRPLAPFLCRLHASHYRAIGCLAHVPLFFSVPLSSHFLLFYALDGFVSAFLILLARCRQVVDRNRVLTQDLQRERAERQRAQARLVAAERGAEGMEAESLRDAVAALEVRNRLKFF